MICTTVMGVDKSDKSNPNEGRAALGDITNNKRPFYLVSSSSPALSSKKPSPAPVPVPIPAPETHSRTEFWKQVALVNEKLEKDRGCGVTVTATSSDEPGLPPLKGGKIYRLQAPSQGATATSLRVVNKPPVSQLDCIDLAQPETDQPDLPNVVTDSTQNQIVEEGCIPNVAVPVLDSGCEEVEHPSLVPDNNCSRQALPVNVSEASDIGSFGLERCSGLKTDTCSHSSDGLDLLKSCSCSFCTKVAYIWSDLHYQDVKGRLSVLMKSQKEASNLAQRYEAEIGKHGQGSASKVPHLETDLTSHWKSLFLNMESIFGGESSQLQTDFLALKDLREDFKTNLEMSHGASSEMQPSSSDASDHVITEAA